MIASDWNTEASVNVGRFQVDFHLKSQVWPRSLARFWITSEDNSYGLVWSRWFDGTTTKGPILYIQRRRLCFYNWGGQRIPELKKYLLRKFLLQMFSKSLQKIWLWQCFRLYRQRGCKMPFWKTLLTFYTTYLLIKTQFLCANLNKTSIAFKLFWITSDWTSKNIAQGPAICKNTNG